MSITLSFGRGTEIIEGTPLIRAASTNQHPLPRMEITMTITVMVDRSMSIATFAAAPRLCQALLEPGTMMAKGSSPR